MGCAGMKKEAVAMAREQKGLRRKETTRAWSRDCEVFGWELGEGPFCGVVDGETTKKRMVYFSRPFAQLHVNIHIEEQSPSIARVPQYFFVLTWDINSAEQPTTTNATAMDSVNQSGFLGFFTHEP